MQDRVERCKIRELNKMTMENCLEKGPLVIPLGGVQPSWAFVFRLDSTEMQLAMKRNKLRGANGQR